jgi:hypothetical protein
VIYNFPAWQLFMLSVGSLVSVVAQPLFYFVIFMIYWQYRKLAARQYVMFRHKTLPVRRAVLQSAVTGMLGGLIASMIVLLTGLSINGIGLQYIWPLAVLLFLLNVRFVCFAYAGGLVALSNVFFGWPDIDPSHMLALVAILHVTEGILVLCGGSHADLPIYLFFKGRAVGGFLLTNFWPVPLVLLIFAGLAPEKVPDILSMPDWWPLFPPQGVSVNRESVFAPITVIAALGYSSVSVTTTPARKRLESGVLLFCYSAVLFAAAYLSIGRPLYAAAAALISFLGHEAVIRIDRKLENRRLPLYQNQPGKFAALATVYGSPAQKAGLKANDVILRLNGIRVYCEEDFLLAADFLPPHFDMEIVRDGREILLPVTKTAESKGVLGIIRMPVLGRDYLAQISADHSFLYKFCEKHLFRRFKRR